MSPRRSLACRIVRTALLGVLVGFASVPARAQAQQSTTRGFSFGAQLIGTSLAVEQDDANRGGGLALRAGYGFNRIVTVFVQLDGSQIDIPRGDNIVGEWGLAHADIGARFHFANSLRRWVPYLEAAVGARSVSVDNPRVDGERLDKLSFNGGAFTVGGGISTHFSPSWALDVSLKVSGGQFTEIDVGSAAIRNLDLDATSTRFGVGVVWWP